MLRRKASPIIALAALLACIVPAGAQTSEQASARSVCNTAFATAIATTSGVKNRMIASAYEEWKFFGQQVAEYGIGATSGRIVAPGWLEDGERAQAGYIGSDWEDKVEAKICAARRELVNTGKLVDSEGERRIQRINAYWRVVADQMRLDGNSGEANVYEKFNGCSVGVPWSAAFISYIMAKAGLTTGEPMRFMPAPGHSDYLSFIASRQSVADEPAFALRDVVSESPRVGGLVCAMRYDKHQPSEFKFGKLAGASHCDLVIEASVNRVLAIGGNVLQSVSCSVIPLAGSRLSTENLGNETPPPEPARPWRVLARPLLP
jgi:hypothetical protein